MWATFPARPVSVAQRYPPLTVISPCQVAPALVDQSITYSLMDAPPVDEGVLHVTKRLCTRALADGLRGALGAV